MVNELTSDRCIEILRDAGCHENVIRHSRVVAEIAVSISERIEGVDIELVRTGALLHDLGRARTHGLTHFLEGVKIAEELGLPREVQLIIERHIGAGLPAAEAKALGLPEKDYIPLTLEEKIVAQADNLVDEFRPAPVAIILNRFKEKGQHAAAERIEKLHGELSALAKCDLDELVRE